MSPPTGPGDAEPLSTSLCSHVWLSGIIAKCFLPCWLQCISCLCLETEVRPCSFLCPGQVSIMPALPQTLDTWLFLRQRRSSYGYCKELPIGPRNEFRFPFSDVAFLSWVSVKVIRQLSSNVGHHRQMGLECCSICRAWCPQWAVSGTSQSHNPKNAVQF